MKKISAIFFVFILFPLSGNANFPEPSPWSVRESQRTLDFLQNTSDKRLLFEKIKARKAELRSRPAIAKTPFQNGFLYRKSGDLVWEQKNGSPVTIARNSEFPGRGISRFFASPDGSKVAFSTTDAGSDVHEYSVRTLSSNPEDLLSQPLLVRRGGINWSKDSESLFFQYYSPKEFVVSGREPIVRVKQIHLDSQSINEFYDHGERAEYHIHDVDGGNTVIAFKKLGPAFGIKTLFAANLGRKNGQGNYDWEPLVAKHRYVSIFLGVRNFNGKRLAIFQTSQSGSNYGIIAVSLEESEGQRSTNEIVPAKRRKVMHNSQLIGNHLILQYNDPRNQEISVDIVDIHSGEVVQTFKPSDVGLGNVGYVSLFKAHTSSDLAYFVHNDALNANSTLTYNFSSRSFERLPNSSEMDVDWERVHVDATHYWSFDGQAKIPITVYRRKNADGNLPRPKFIFLRTYGAISVINRAEAAELHMVLEMGGAYATASIRGGGEKGADWFLAGAKSKRKTVADIAAASRFLRDWYVPFKRYRFGPRDVVALGRSWGGMHSLLLKKNYSQDFGYIMSIVPIVDLQKFFHTAWSGRVLISDLAPPIDSRTGDYVFGRRFWRRIARSDPAETRHRYRSGANLFINISQKDDRIDQTNESYELASDLMSRLGSDSVRFFEREGVAHGNRSYQPLVLGLIADFYGISSGEFGR